QTLGRNTTGEVFAAINADLDQAATLISPDFAEPTFMTRDFVTALRARMALYRKQYQQADQFAAQLIDKYELATPEEYLAIFHEDANIANTEIIFKLARTVGDSYDGQGFTGSPYAGGWAGANFAFVDATLDGSPYFEMGRTLFNLLDPADIRYEVNVADSILINENYPNVSQEDWYDTDKIAIFKYPGVEGVQPLMNDLKVFRVSEMYLIRAEAAAAANDLTAAANYIKQIRDARFGAPQSAPVFASQQAAYAGVLEERRVELAFEGHRWLDLKRLGADANAQIDRDPLDCAITGACTLPIDDHRFTLPIPLVEINANSVIAEQQNPGYEAL
ncbi:MAG: RagB/SusD family nutrient uptake outer membrane protein, partial [Cyclobacteriaceae bacterium]